MKPKPFYAVNYSKIHSDRTTESKLFNMKKEANLFLESQPHGYALRLVEGGTKIIKMKNFEPSAGTARWLSGVFSKWNN